MTRLATAFILLSSVTTPAVAQEEAGGSLMEEGMKLFMRGLMTEMEPALRELEEFADEARPFLRDFAQEMGPALRDLMDKVDDWSAYHPPEMLPNGDIILRKKTPAERAAEESDEIEL